MRLARLCSSVLLLLQLATAASALDPALHCVDAKNKAAARALKCLAKEHQRLLLGRPSDPSACHATLARAFANAEKPGACPVTGNAAAVEQRVDAVAADVLDALHAAMATTDAQKRCLMKENNAAAGFAVCLANALSRRLRGEPFPISIVINTDVGNCFVAASRPFENTPDCLVDFIGRDVPLDLAIAAATNLEGADLRRALLFAPLTGANLRDTDLSGHYLAGVSLENADLTGADLSNAVLGLRIDGANLGNVTWSATRCPDDTFSNTNGSSPESCCGHLGSASPLACSP
ncbi:pentapeptide repeat-containing protein [Candidatus Binatia bacterium]|nr:pentapeptide repeat-containing protein [Candidatus Binatia bacterium]